MALALVIEVVVDESQLTDADRQRVESSVSDAVEGALGSTFWYRERKTFDYEYSVKWDSS